jgi:hypothetical protein
MSKKIAFILRLSSFVPYALPSLTLSRSQFPLTDARGASPNNSYRETQLSSRRPFQRTFGLRIAPAPPCGSGSFAHILFFVSGAWNSCFELDFDIAVANKLVIALVVSFAHARLVSFVIRLNPFIGINLSNVF